MFDEQRKFYGTPGIVLKLRDLDSDPAIRRHDVPWHSFTINLQKMFLSFIQRNKEGSWLLTWSNDWSRTGYESDKLTLLICSGFSLEEIIAKCGELERKGYVELKR